MATASNFIETDSRHNPVESHTNRLDPKLLRRLYAYMLKCRMVEERIRILYRQGRFAGNYFAAVGQEATEVGATLDLLPEDTVAPSHRNFVTNIMKGTPLPLMFAHIYGRKTSPDQGRSAPAHCGYAPLNVITPSSTIAAQLNIGTGIALAYKLQRKQNVVVALSGEGSTSLGFWHEAVNFAGVQKLPIIFVVENNLYAESVPVSLQTAVEDISTKAAGYGVPGETVDGNDVVAVYTAMRAAISGLDRAAAPPCSNAKPIGGTAILRLTQQNTAILQRSSTGNHATPFRRWSVTSLRSNSGQSSGNRSSRRSAITKSTRRLPSRKVRLCRKGTRREALHIPCYIAADHP